MTAWANNYVGIPYAAFGRTRAGADCWGLACVIYAAELSIQLPDYLGYASVDERREIDALIAGAEASPLWAARAGAPQPFDIAVFRNGRFASHLGVVLRPGLMIHMAGEDRAKIEAYSTGRWGTRLLGHFRWVGHLPTGEIA